MSKRYLTLIPRVPASKRPFHGSMQHNYKGGKAERLQETLNYTDYEKQLKRNGLI